ncbi:hypothetical protein NQ318_014083 [Aromia moschata]|uniref:Uncharacterized protein n=1 Tax=Aromia moschata TaxID=1265417 RepID=A0AAV8YY53_9CUCU|nr:hypothetical protein NQ318_014083 [Aromia moschata]
MTIFCLIHSLYYHTHTIASVGRTLCLWQECFVLSPAGNFKRTKNKKKTGRKKNKTDSEDEDSEEEDATQFDTDSEPDELMGQESPDSVDAEYANGDK